MEFSATDLDQLAALGIPAERARRQLERLRAGQAWTRLARACRPGDGILQIPAELHPSLAADFDRAVAAGRLTRFVPASGAATRMFALLYADAESLAACRTAAPPADRSLTELHRFFACLPQFAFYPELAAAMRAAGDDLEQARFAGDFARIIGTLLEADGLGYAELPKGLLAFHATPEGARTPFIEHLAEAALLTGGPGPVRLHFTVSPHHARLFEAQLHDWRGRLEARYGTRLEVGFSAQKPSTDTLALHEDAPLRDAEGRLALRPGGHGALIENLNDLSGDLVQVRNIDNVVPDARKAANLHWTRVLGGYLLALEDEQHALLKILHDRTGDPMVHDLALAFLCDRLGADVPFDASEDELIAWLDRPLRVCGMVANSGEPGGGPFWVKTADGRLSRQIVEGAQIDRDDPGQLGILHDSTHFNPVDMLCAVRDWQGRPYDLTRFVDEDAVIITRKAQAGQDLRVLELPGLWNGGMGRWHTLFVEIPPACFNPVKTVLDLLRPAHQP